MDNRNGKCESCGAEYQIPASFTHDTARCQVCKGVVRIEAAQAAEPAATPAPAPEPTPAPPAEPAVEEIKPRLKKGEGSTLARLRAERAKAEGGQEAKLAAAKPAAPKPVAKPVAAKPVAAKPVAKGAKADGEAKAPAAPKGVVKSTRAGSGRTSSRRSGGGGRKRESSRGGGEKKKSPVPMLAGFGALLLIAGGLFFFKDSLFGSEEPQNEVAAAETEEPTEGTETPADTEGTEGSEGTGGEGDMGADGGEDGADPAAEGDDESNPFDEAAEEKKPREVDVNSVDLSEIADFGKVDDTTDEEWAQMNEWMATWMDVDAGASGNRAKKKLLDKKRKAFPVILNHFKTLDLGTPDGKSNGDQCQRALQDICNGNNFGWKYELTNEDVLFNKKVIRSWSTQWERSIDNMEYWIKMAKLDTDDPEEARRLREFAGLATPTGGAAEEDDLGGGLDID